MNSDLETLIESLVGDLPEAERNEARNILRSSQFADANDPVFGLLRYLQLRTTANGQRERPLAAGVAKLAEEMDNRLWEARRFKWGFFVGCVGLAFFFGGLAIGATFFYGAKTNPSGMSKYLGLPEQTVDDERVTQLESAGVRFRVGERQKGVVAVGLTGDLLATDSSNGEVKLLFRKRP